MCSSFSINTENTITLSLPLMGSIQVPLRDSSTSKEHPILERIRMLNDKVIRANNYLRQGQLSEALPLIKNLLVAEASWHIKPLSSDHKIQKAYQNFRDNVLALQKRIDPVQLDNWVALGKDDAAIQQRKIVARWVLSNQSQRDFAAYYNHAEVPLKYSEIPAGSVLLTDPYAYLAHMKLSGKRSLLRSALLIFKALLCRLLTGMRLTHAEFCMGNGKIFDLDKKKGAWIKGEGMIKEKGDSIFYGVVIKPNQKKMLAAHNERFPDAPCKDFSEIMKKMNKEIEDAVQKNRVKLNIGDIIKTAIPSKRAANYDPTKTWNGGACQYSCSGTTSALFSRCGIDIGKEFNKKDKNVTPSNFFDSHFFTAVYTIP